MENAFHKWLAKNLPPSDDAIVGVGDDAAVLNWAARNDCVVTSDMLAEGVHFVLNDAGPARVGRKSLAVNLSDLAAMGARPVAAVVSLMLPTGRATGLAEDLISGMLPLAKELSVAIVGGDTNTWSGDLVISVTAFGTRGENGGFTRSGATPGDAVLVTGQLGGSRLSHHLDFTPRVSTALRLEELAVVHAAMDLSDGLSLDAARMAEQSGCGIEIAASSVPISAAARDMSRAGSGKTPLEHALGDGEDFELLIAVPTGSAARLAADKDLELTQIGKCVTESGLWLVQENGSREALIPTGYEHE